MAKLIRKGGKGSGNWGHAGRPGKVGGSAPRGGAQGVSIVNHMTIGDLTKKVKSAIARHHIFSDPEYDYYGIRFENRLLKAGDMVGNSRHNPSRDDERDFPDYGTPEYGELPELRGASAWYIGDDGRWRLSYSEPYNDESDALLVDAEHAYIIAGNKDRTHEDADDNEIVIGDAVVIERLF